MNNSCQKNRVINVPNAIPHVRIHAQTPDYLKFRENIQKRHEYEQKKREEASMIHDSIKRGGRFGGLPQSKAKG